MVQERIKAVFAQVFQVDPAELSAEVSPAQIAAWDSFGHLSLVDALQEEFQVEFQLEDIAQMDNLRAIEEILRLRGAGAS
jgi:acyl carrier protein